MGTLTGGGWASEWVLRVGVWTVTLHLQTRAPLAVFTKGAYLLRAWLRGLPEEWFRQLSRRWFTWGALVRVTNWAESAAGQGSTWTATQVDPLGLVSPGGFDLSRWRVRLRGTLCAVGWAGVLAGGNTLQE